jgi:hypothetical protein
MKKAAENYGIRFFSLLKPIEEEDPLLRSVRNAVTLFAEEEQTNPLIAPGRARPGTSGFCFSNPLPDAVIAERKAQRQASIAFEVDTTNRVGAFEVQIAVCTSVTQQPDNHANTMSSHVSCIYYIFTCILVVHMYCVFLWGYNRIMRINTGMLRLPV